MPFNLFSRKKTGPIVTDLVWINSAARMEGCRSLLSKHPDAIVAAWFNETIQQFQDYLANNGLTISIRNIRQLSSAQVEDKSLIVLEHYPLASKEEQLIANWKPLSMIVLNSLDQPLFVHFGGNRIASLMQQMGMQENESVEHKMISQALRNAQQKLEEKLVTEHSATSQEEWFRKNAEAK